MKILFVTHVVTLGGALECLDSRGEHCEDEAERAATERD